MINGGDARSTRVSAQYTVGDGGGEPQRTFGPRGIVEDAVIEDGGILTKLSPRSTRVNTIAASSDSQIGFDFFVDPDARTKETPTIIGPQSRLRPALLSARVFRGERKSPR